MDDRFENIGPDEFDELDGQAHAIEEQRTRVSDYDEFGNYIGPEEQETDEQTSEQPPIVSFITELDPSSVRNVTLVGHFQHGKTLFMKRVNEIAVKHIDDQSNTDDDTEHIDEQSHTDDDTAEHIDEQSHTDDDTEDTLTIKAVPMTILLKDSNSKSYLCNMMDTPGHLDFSDEATASIRLADGAVLIVDVCEGVMLNTELLIHQVLRENLPVILVLNKVDRLITELPPEGLYDHLKSLVHQINGIFSTAGSGHILDPVVGNVCFASAADRWCFTLQSLAKGYVKLHGIPIEANVFALHLWGDYYFDPDSKSFTEKQPVCGVKKSFVHVVLEPLNNLYKKITKGDWKSVKDTLSELGLTSANTSNVKTLLRQACKKVFGASGFVGVIEFVNMMVNHIPSPKAAQPSKVAHIYSGPKENSTVYQAMKECSRYGSLMINITKMYRQWPKDGGVDALGRVYSGVIAREEEVLLLSERDDSPDDFRIERVQNLFLPQFENRRKITTGSVPAGCWVLIEGVDARIGKTATLCDPKLKTDVSFFHPLQFNTIPVVKRALKHLFYSYHGLCHTMKSYVLAETTIENSRCVISGTGELYLESIRKELQETYKEEVEVSPPFVTLTESIVDSSSGEFNVAAANGQINIRMVAEPLDSALVRDIEKGVVSPNWPREKVQEFLQTNHNWEMEAAKLYWTLTGPNILLGDVFSANVEDAIASGFLLGVKEGPLCDEPIRAVSFRVLEARIAQEVLNLHDGITQIILAAQRATHSAFFNANPQLMEPLYHVEVRTPKIFQEKIISELSSRGGQRIERLLRGPLLIIIKAFLPVNQSFGLDEAVRECTRGQASCQAAFLHDWVVAPQQQQLIMKTRLRKGMEEQKDNEDAPQEEQELQEDAPPEEEDESHDEQ